MRDMNYMVSSHIYLHHSIHERIPTLYDHFTALMNELHKLRSENEDLVRKINASSIDALDLLESQIADQKCINKSLQVTTLI